MTTTDEMQVSLTRDLTERALAHVRAGTTEMSSDVLRVPLSYYRDRDVLDAEEQMLRVTPLAVAASAQIPEPGDYLVREVLGTSLLVTRDDDGEAHVLLNYCRHRGAKPAEGCGNARRFTCPYHAWVYDQGGQLVGLPGAEGFDGMDRSTHGLVELPNEERHGFVFAVLDRDAELDLDSHLGAFGAQLDEFDYGSFQFLEEREFESNLNWKGALEAFAESYHFPYVHGESIIGMNTVGNTSIHDAFGPHHRMGFPLNWITALDDDPDGSWDPREQMGLILWVFPNLILANSPLGVEVLDILPAGDPTRCFVRHGWMARYPASSDEETAQYQQIYEEMHAAVRDEDFTMLPSCGEGVRQGQHDYMAIGRNEIGVQHMIRTLAGRVGVELGA